MQKNYKDLKSSDYTFHTHGMTPALSLRPNDGKITTYKGAYISITNRCNIDVCNYCYARSEAKAPDMSVQDFSKAIEWLSTISDCPEVNLLGGEPSTHPDLVPLLDVVLAQKWSAKLFTNGFFEKDICHRLARHPALLRVAFHYEETFARKVPRYTSRLNANIETLNKTKECYLAIVIGSKGFDFETPYHLAKRYRLAITWVFSTPTAGKTPYFGLADMKALASKLEDFLIKCTANGIQTAPALPLPLCIFSGRFFEDYHARLSLIRKCRPFIYIKTDLSTQFCSSMPQPSAPAPEDHEALKHIIMRNRQADIALKQKPSFDECLMCPPNLYAICQGGCMTYKVYGTPQCTDNKPSKVA